MGLLRRDPYRHLPAPPRPSLHAGVPAARDVVSSRLEALVVPDAAAVTREGAWTVPAVANGLQVIAGTIGGLPLLRLDRATWWPVTDEAGWFEQLDPAEPTAATLTRLVEDMVLYPAAYLVVLARYASGYPASTRYVPFEGVAQQEDGSYRISLNGSSWAVPEGDVLRFPSPTPGLLTIGARFIATTLSLDAAARRLADADLPAGALKNTGADLAGAEVDELLARWETARRTRSTGYLNAQLDFETFQWDAAQLQLADGRNYQVAEAARLLNLPSRYLNAPTGSSMVYSTLEAQRRELVDLSLRPYLAAIEGRLSMGDATPRTQVARFDLDDFLRGDATERTAVAEARIRMGMTSEQEERQRERIPGRAPGKPTPAPPAVAAPQEGPADA